jgi:hypothetical protein
MTAVLLTLFAAIPGLCILAAFCFVNRKPAKVIPCGDPACEACALSGNLVSGVAVCPARAACITINQPRNARVQHEIW